MRATCIMIALCLPVGGLAQGVGCAGGGSGGSSGSSNGGSQMNGQQGCVPARPVGIGNLQSNQRNDPPSAAIRWGLSSSYRGRSSPGRSYFTRTLIDATNHVYFGYELLLEEQQPGTYLATFGKLDVTPMEAAASTGSKLNAWSIQPLPALPEPRVVHEGDVISLELRTDAATGAKLIEDIEIHPYSQRPLLVSTPANRALPTIPSRTVPTVAGNARDFSAADAELQLSQPRVTLNGTLQESTPTRGGVVSALPLPLAGSNVRGSLVWLYLPSHGRYILSLVPRPDLNFVPAGEVRGGAATFTVGEDSIKLECFNPIATGDAAYHLYVLHDPEWEPTAQAQKGQFALGSVAPGELAGLKRK